MESHSPERKQPWRHLAVAGLGNIGSQLVPLLCRLGLSKLTLIDPDRYEEHNLAGQNILRSDIGKKKTAVCRRRSKRIDHQLALETFEQEVQAVPLGKLRSACLVSCLDSRLARQYVNESAWRLGIPWIDTAIDAAEQMVRVNVYPPAADAPCLECAWNTEDYAALETQYPCRPDTLPSVAPTAAPARLGALAAALAATECDKLLAGEHQWLLSGQQCLYNVRHHKQLLTSFRRRGDCRFDHATWNIEAHPCDVDDSTLPQLLEDLTPAEDHGQAVEIGIVAQPFAAALSCSDCGEQQQHVYCPVSRLSPARRRCPRCMGKMKPRAIDRFDHIHLEQLPRSLRRRRLRSFGLRQGDVLSVRQGRQQRYVELLPAVMRGAPARSA